VIGAGYAARFEGGCLDGETLTVRSLLPRRYAMRTARAGVVPGAMKPMGAKYDGYDLVEHDPVVYRHNAQASSRR
jgi:hypothetical protein